MTGQEAWHKNLAESGVSVTDLDMVGLAIRELHPGDWEGKHLHGLR